MKVTMIPSVISAFITIPKGLVRGGELEIGGRGETIQTTA